MTNNTRPLSRMKALGDLKPVLRFGFRPPWDATYPLVRIIPYGKAWGAIVVVALMLAGMSAPLFSIGLGGGGNEDLFDLTFNLFQWFWMLGWSVGILFLAILLLAMLFAREVIRVKPDDICLRLEILNIGIETHNPLPFLSRFRYVTDDYEAGSKWRGPHLSVDYLGVPVAFGSELDPAQASELMGAINKALEHPIPNRPPHTTEELVRRYGRPASPTRASHDPAAPVADVPVTDSPIGHASFTLLLLANLVPLAGVFLFGWRIADIMLLFWLESAIIGFFNILKIIRIAGPVAFFYALFFIGHFGCFMAVHLMFIFALFIEGEASLPLAEVRAVFVAIWPAILALFISHGFSFLDNFIRRGEYRRLTVNQQMGKPYSRIVLMHLTLIFGGFLIMALDSPLAALVLLIVLKIIVDGAAHLREHRPKRPASS